MGGSSSSEFNLPLLLIFPPVLDGWKYKPSPPDQPITPPNAYPPISYSCQTPVQVYHNVLPRYGNLNQQFQSATQVAQLASAHNYRRLNLMYSDYSRVKPAGMLRDGSIMPVALRQARRSKFTSLCAFFSLPATKTRARPCRLVIGLFSQWSVELNDNSNGRQWIIISVELSHCKRNQTISFYDSITINQNRKDIVVWLTVFSFPLIIIRVLLPAGMFGSR